MSATTTQKTEGLTAVEQLRAEAVSAVLRAWEAAGFSVCILHGLDHPPRVGRDIDCLIDPGQTDAALAKALQVLQALGFEVVFLPPLWGKTLAAFREREWASGLEIHALPGVIWQNVVFARIPSKTLVLLANGGRVDPWASFAKRVLLPLLGSGAVAKVLREPLEEEHHKEVAVRLSRLAGAARATQFLRLFEAGDLEGVVRILPRLRNALRFRTLLRSPVESVILAGRQFGKVARTRFSAFAPIVQLAGTKGPEMETLLKGLSSKDSSIFTGIVIHNELLSGAAGRSKGGTVYKSLQIARHWLRYWWRDRHETGAQRLVIYDGWPQSSSSSEQDTSGEQPVGKSLQNLWPNPDLTIFLLKSDASRRAQNPTRCPPQNCGPDIQVPSGERIALDQDPKEVEDQVRKAIVGTFLRMNQPCYPAAT